jgi:predicted aspartyl protease
MSLSRRSNCFLAVLACAAAIPAIAQLQEQNAQTPNIVTAKIKVNDLSMIIVPVCINGSGPFDFLLDTGASKTIVDQKLADQLGLLRQGQKMLNGVLASVRMSVVHVNTLSVAGVTVAGGDVLSSDHPASVSSNVRGVLGEDFLENFDLLIDYRHQVIRFEAPLESMAETAVGEHIPLQVNGMLNGRPTYNRLLLSASIPQLGATPILLLLDSGSNHPTLLRDVQGLGNAMQESMRAGNFNQWTNGVASAYTVSAIRVGESTINDLTFISLPRHADVDTDGLLPTSLFHSVFICFRGRFVILNPSFSETLSAADTVRHGR